MLHRKLNTEHSKDVNTLLIIKGKFNTIKCFCTTIDDTAKDQLQAMCDSKIFTNNKIRVMPDVHAGKGCTIGHAALVHGCTVGDHTMIGMGAIVLGGAQIGNNCIVAAGAVVKENMVVPDGQLVMGVPARIVGPVRQELIDDIYKNEQEYLHLSAERFGK